jgi:hypothetical protein
LYSSIIPLHLFCHSRSFSFCRHSPLPPPPNGSHPPLSLDIDILVDPVFSSIETAVLYRMWCRILPGKETEAGRAEPELRPGQPPRGHSLRGCRRLSRRAFSGYPVLIGFIN